VTAKTYQSRPVRIEAMQWTGDNFDELFGWIGYEIVRKPDGLRLFVAANDRWLPLTVGEWVAKDRHGFYPIKDDVFTEKYEQVETVIAGHGDQTERTIVG